MSLFKSGSKYESIIWSVLGGFSSFPSPLHLSWFFSLRPRKGGLKSRISQSLLKGQSESVSSQMEHWNLKSRRLSFQKHLAFPFSPILRHLLFCFPLKGDSSPIQTLELLMTYTHNGSLSLVPASLVPATGSPAPTRTPNSSPLTQPHSLFTVSPGLGSSGWDVFLTSPARTLKMFSDWSTATEFSNGNRKVILMFFQLHWVSLLLVQVRTLFPWTAWGNMAWVQNNQLSN